MARTKKEALEELAKYSKEDILEALGRSCFVDVDAMLIDLEYIQRTRAIDEHQKAIADESAALTAYLEWNREVIAKYGDGETVRFDQLPESEVQRGIKLERIWRSARKKEKRLDDRVRKLLNL